MVLPHMSTEEVLGGLPTLLGEAQDFLGERASQPWPTPHRHCQQPHETLTWPEVLVVATEPAWVLRADGVQRQLRTQPQQDLPEGMKKV